MEQVEKLASESIPKIEKYGSESKNDSTPETVDLDEEDRGESSLYESEVLCNFLLF